jgi:uncharacterized membrane protein
MAKILTILLIAIVFEAIGVVFLSRGLKEIGEPDKVNFSGIAKLVGRGFTNGNIIRGVFFEALFFVGLLMLMSRAEVSFIWPLTALGFVATTLSAKLFLHEEVSLARWTGVLLITAGAALVSWTEKAKEPPPPTTNTAAPPSVR